MSDADQDTLHEREAIPPVIVGLAENLRRTAESAEVTGRWVCQITWEAPDGGHDEGELPDGYYDIKDSSDVRAAGAALEAATPEQDLPEISDMIELWQLNDLLLSKDADGALRWLYPAEWEAYDVREQTDCLDTCAANLRKGADTIDEMAKALHLAKAMIEQAMEHHIYDHDDEIPEDCSFTAGLKIIDEALAKARA